MKEFRIDLQATFPAEDLDDALLRLAAHLTLMASDEDDKDSKSPLYWSTTDSVSLRGVAALTVEEEQRVAAADVARGWNPRE